MNTPINLESLSRTTVWQKPYRRMMRMRAEANVLAEAFETSSIAAKEHIPQHVMTAPA